MDGRLDYWTAPDGWGLRRYRLGEGGRGRMLVLGGRGDMIEKYLEVIRHWAARGWAVTGFDWRGQGGSGRTTADPLRSEEHTSELQSLMRKPYAVFCLKKNTSETTT